MKTALSADGVVSKGKKRIKEITVTYVNELRPGVFEKALADIYIKKAKNGTLNIDEDSENVKTAE